jgi:hypothetical protein
MRVKCGPAAGPLRGVFSFSLRFGTSMEQIRNADHVTVIRDEFVEARSVKIEPASVQRIDRALAAAANNLDEARQALEMLCIALPDSAGDAVRALPILLTVRETCTLLGYKPNLSRTCYRNVRLAAFRSGVTVEQCYHRRHSA